eukprot:2673627-Prymnesium_polylepis.1
MASSIGIYERPTAHALSRIGRRPLRRPLDADCALSEPLEKSGILSTEPWQPTAVDAEARRLYALSHSLRMQRQNTPISESRYVASVVGCHQVKSRMQSTDCEKAMECAAGRCGACCCAAAPPWKAPALSTSACPCVCACSAWPSICISCGRAARRSAIAIYCIACAAAARYLFLPRQESLSS